MIAAQAGEEILNTVRIPFTVFAFLAGKGDIGGFGVSSDFTWNFRGSVGCRFNKSVSLKVGYRYFDTDYSDGGFTYDIAESGALIGLNFRFQQISPSTLAESTPPRLHAILRKHLP